MNKIRLAPCWTLAAMGLAAYLGGMTATARAQSDAPAPPSDLPPPAATDSTGAPIPSTQPPAFVPAPVAPRTGPKPAEVLGDTTSQAEADTQTDKDKPSQPSPPPPEIRQETQAEVLPPAAPIEPVRAATSTSSPRSRYGLAALGGAFLVGGGFQQFTNNGLQDVTGGGGYWNARAIAGTRQYVGLEAAYVGAAHNLNALGVGNRAGLISNGVEGAARLNLPVIAGRSLFEPFGFVGVGWSRYNVVNTQSNTSDVADLDDIMTVPYGGGIEIAYGAFMADARFTYRYTYFNDLMRTSGGRLNSWGVGGQLGVSF